jgi:hypothetical protein
LLQHEFFLILVCLGAASQRIEALSLYLAGTLLDMPFLLDILADWKRRERGAFPGVFESCVIVYITGKQFISSNLLMLTRNFCFC